MKGFWFVLQTFDGILTLMGTPESEISQEQNSAFWSALELNTLSHCLQGCFYEKAKREFTLGIKKADTWQKQDTGLTANTLPLSTPLWLTLSLWTELYKSLDTKWQFNFYDHIGQNDSQREFLLKHKILP